MANADKGGEGVFCVTTEAQPASTQYSKKGRSQYFMHAGLSAPSAHFSNGYNGALKGPPSAHGDSMTY